MSRTRFLQKLALIGIAGAISIAGIQSSADAQMTIEGGYSIFASPDPGVGNGQGDNPNVDPTAPGPDANSLQCQFCDTTNSFAVWRNQSGSLTQDLESFNIPAADIITLFGTQFDDNAPYLFLYEVVNTNPLPFADSIPAELPIEDFNISVVQKDNAGVDQWAGPSPYSSGGYINRHVFLNASRDTFDNPLGQPTDPLGGTRVDQDPDLNCVMKSSLAGQIERIPGCPANWTPDVLDVKFEIGIGPGVPPTALDYVPLNNDEIERLRPEVNPTFGMNFSFDNPNIGVTGNPNGIPDNSFLLFLTAYSEEEYSNVIRNLQPGDPFYDPNLVAWANEVWLNYESYPWAETQSGTGEGTKGDLPGVKIAYKVPEPTSILGLLAIGGLGLGRLSLKRKKEQT